MLLYFDSFEVSWPWTPFPRHIKPHKDAGSQARESHALPCHAAAFQAGSPSPATLYPECETAGPVFGVDMGTGHWAAVWTRSAVITVKPPRPTS